MSVKWYPSAEINFDGFQTSLYYYKTINIPNYTHIDINNKLIYDWNIIKYKEYKKLLISSVSQNFSNFIDVENMGNENWENAIIKYEKIKLQDTPPAYTPCSLEWKCPTCVWAAISSKDRIYRASNISDKGEIILTDVNSNIYIIKIDNIDTNWHVQNVTDVGVVINKFCDYREEDKIQTTETKKIIKVKNINEQWRCYYIKKGELAIVSQDASLMKIIKIDNIDINWSLDGIMPNGEIILTRN
jgi:hypothetical protein